jgi:hypothetical protein
MMGKSPLRYGAMTKRRPRPRPIPIPGLRWVRICEAIRLLSCADGPMGRWAEGPKALNSAKDWEMHDLHRAVICDEVSLSRVGRARWQCGIAEGWGMGDGECVVMALEGGTGVLIER